MTSVSAEKVHLNLLRRWATRQGYMLIKSPRRDPRSRGFGTFVLVPDHRNSFWDPKDPELIKAAHEQMDRGEGLTMAEVEQRLGYRPEES